MANYNKVTLVGRLTRDPELKKFGEDRCVTNFSLAVSEQYISQNEKKEQVNFFDCEIFGPRAEVFAKFLSKGRSVLIEGKLRQDKWEDENQNKRSKVVIRVDDFEFLDSKREDKQEEDVPQEPAKPQGQNRVQNKNKTPF